MSSLINQKWVLNIMEEIGKKYDLPLYVVEEIFNSQFKTLRENIKKTEKPLIIMLPKWGKYYPSEAKLKYINDANNNKNTSENKE
jgi:hypothetical protein